MEMFSNLCNCHIACFSYTSAVFLKDKDYCKKA